jgi:hypothetical protein
MQMNINDLIDQFVEVKAKREALSNEVKQCTSKLAALENDIMSLMSEAGISKAGNDKATCSMRQTLQPAIDDWKVFYDYVAETGQFELLHKRLSSTAFRERWDAGEAIPGTSTSAVWELTVYRK